MFEIQSSQLAGAGQCRREILCRHHDQGS
jgi:hypothetical protein